MAPTGIGIRRRAGLHCLDLHEACSKPAASNLEARSPAERRRRTSSARRFASRLAGGQAQTATADLDVYFVVDTSTSMAAEDYNGTGTRLSGVKQDVMAIAKELAGAKFSLLTFDNKATVRMPLTRDATALQTAMTTLQPPKQQIRQGGEQRHGCGRTPERKARSR